MGECNVFGCNRTVNKAGHLLCYEHWKCRAGWAGCKLDLVELNDNDIPNLDDVLPRMLLRYGVDCTESERVGVSPD